MKRLSVVVAVIVVAELLLYMSWSYIDDNNPFPSLSLQLEFLASLVLFAGPAVLGAGGLTGRPALLPAAGLLTLPMALLSFVFLPYPLLGLVFAFAFVFKRRPAPTVPTGVLTMLILLLMVGAGYFGLFVRDMRCNDYVTYREDGRQRTVTLDEFKQDVGSPERANGTIRPPATGIGTSCGENVPPVGSLASLCLSLTAVIGGRAGARPKEPATSI